jgi:hypothetical protein
MRIHSIYSGIVSLIAVHLLAQPAFTQQLPPFPEEGPPLIVHEIIRGKGSGDFGSWPRSNGDIDRDGIVEIAPTFSGGIASVIHGGDLTPVFAFQASRDFNVTPWGPYTLNIYSGLALKAGVNVHGVIWGTYPHQSHWLPFMQVWDLNTKRLVHDVPFPSAPSPNLPAPDLWEDCQQVGDLDGDGYDELLVHLLTINEPYNVFGLLDGLTNTWKWIDYYPSLSNGSMLVNTWPDPCQDINGDGVKDIQYAFWIDGPPHAPAGEWVTRCLSGIDGSDIWTDIRPSWGFKNDKPSSVIGDINQDGIRDIIQWSNAATLWGPGEVRVISGADGSLIWEETSDHYDPYAAIGWPAGFNFQRFADATGDLNLDGIPDITILADAYDGVSQYSELDFWILSGADGNVLTKEPVRVSYEPWQMSGYSGFFPAGDIDGDGWSESVVLLQDHVSIDTDMGFLGRRTLYNPDQVHSGETITFRVHIPTGANKGFKLLLSTGFDPLHDGAHLGTWNTHLLPSQLLRATRYSPQTDGTLNQFGMGEITIRIPSRMNLAGQELTAVAIVKDSSRPSGVLTKSSMSVITVLP